MSADVLLRAFRHDAHKLRARPHSGEPTDLDGVTVDESVPMGADADAAALSRPSGEPTVTVANHDARNRLSLLTGRSCGDPKLDGLKEIDSATAELFLTDDVERVHEAWLSSDLAATVNESVYSPYTSLKYHTLLVVALVDNYRTGAAFDELRLVVDPPTAVTPCRTVLAGERFNLRLDTVAGSNPSARLGSRPWRSWASVWSRLGAHPLDADGDRFDRLLDAQLRRIWSWSTALQFVEDFEGWRSRR